MKEEIVITFYGVENISQDHVLDITGKGEDILGYDGNECGSDAVFIFVSKCSLEKCLDWFHNHGLKEHRIETFMDYSIHVNEGKPGNFFIEDRDILQKTVRKYYSPKRPVHGDQCSIKDNTMTIVELTGDTATYRYDPLTQKISFVERKKG